MKCLTPLLVATLALGPGLLGAQSLVNGTSYPDLFGPGSSAITVDPPNSLIGLTLGGTASGSLNSYWDATAEGGASLRLIVGLAETGAQVALNGSELQFNVGAASPSLLGALGTGLSLDLDWQATASFGGLALAPNTIYNLSFDVDGSNGLLNSTLGVAPSFTVELLDGSNAVGSAGNGNLVNILGLELLGIVGSPPGSGRATVQFQTGNTVSGDDVGIRFSGSALAPATVLGLGREFASVSNLQLAAVPEPSAFLLSATGLLLVVGRRRRSAA